MNKQRAFVGYTKAGNIIPGSLVITQGSYPNGPGLWKEITANLCCENTTTMNYKVYTALLTQETGNPLVVDVLENTIGNIVWTHPGVGQYQATLAGAFPLNKTALFINNSLWNNQNVTYISPMGTGDNIMVETYNYLNTTLIDNVLGYTAIEIRVYP